MAGIEVAQAYVSIIPSMKGIQGDIADALNADKVGSDAGDRLGEGISSGLSAKAVVIGNVITDAIRGAVTGAVDLGKSLATGIYDGFGDFEQLAGGMQKLFGDDASSVIDNASQAFKTAGMSANDYMSNVTSIAASLVNSVGGDTAEAARMADVAMRAMSDNVNTFGTDAGNVQNAIMGMAKGNFSMLDNLSLGFAGTKHGMMDLINASGVLDEQLTDVSQVDDVGFATMIEAIQAVQDEMGITGTTAKEAMGTLQGSATAASAAWQNVLTAIGTGDASSVKSATDGLLDAIFGTISEETGEREGGVIQNVVGLASRAFAALGQALPSMLDAALSALPPDIGGPLREAFDTIATTITTVAPYVSAAIGTVVTAIGTIAPVVAPLLPLIAGALGAVKIVGVITSIVGAITTFVGAAGTAISMISGIPALATVIVTALGGPVTIIAAIVGAIVAFIATNEDARNAVINTWNAIRDGITKAINAVKPVVVAVANYIVSNVTGKFRSLVNVVRAIFNGVKSAISEPLNTAKTAVSNAIGTIKSIVNGAHLSLPHFRLPHFRINGGVLPWGIGGKGSPPSVNVDWYARGGWVDDATLIGAGERGGELIWPGYAPYLDRYAQAIAERMPSSSASGGNTYNITVTGVIGPDDTARAVERRLRMMQLVT